MRRFFMFKRNEQFLEPEYTTSLQKHVVRTFGWMCLGVLVTAVIATVLYMLDLTPILTSGMFPLIILFTQMGVVITLASRLMKMTPATAKILFLGYAALTGVTFSVIAMTYLPGTIALAFFVTTVYFGSLVIIGYTTKINILRFGPIIYAGFFAFFITQIVMFFLRVDGTSMLMSGIGLAIFTAITAYDTQKMKALYTQYENDEVMLSRLSILSAFTLYLDFINIFLYILRFLGNKD